MSVDKKNGVNDGINRSKQDDTNIRQRFIKDFIKQETTGEKKNNKNKLLDSIFDNDTLIPELKGKLESKLKGGVSSILGLDGRNYNEYEGLDIKDIKINDLKNESLRDYVVLNNKRESIKREVLKNYDIDNKGYDESIEREVKILSLAELEKLQKRTDLDTFLSKVLGKNKPEPKELLNIFSQIKGIPDEKLKELYKKSNGKLRNILVDLGARHGRGHLNSLSKTDLLGIRDLFRYEVLSESFKIEFLKHYLSEISLKNYQEIFNISAIDIKAKKRELLKNSFPYLEGDEEEINYLVDQVNDADVCINISDIHFSSRDLVRILKNTEVFIDISKRYGEDYDFENKVLEKNNKVPNFEKKLKEHGVRGFHKGNILAFRLKEKETGNIKTHYYKIVDVGEKDGRVHLIEKSKNNLYQRGNNKTVDFSQEGILSVLEKKDFSGVSGRQEKGEKQRKGSKQKAEGLSLEDFSCYTEEDFQKKIQDIENKEFLEDTNEIHLHEEGELEEKYKEAIEERKKELLVEQGKLAEDITDEDIAEVVLEPEDIILQEKNKEIESYNLNTLKQKIDELDTKGQEFGLDKNVTFQTKASEKGEKGYFTITSIDPVGFGKDKNGEYIGTEPGCIEIVPVQGGPRQTLSFRDFFEGWKQEKPIRTSKVNSMDTLFTDVKGYDTIGDQWGNFEFKDNGIYKKEGRKDAKYEYDFLASTNSKELLKIHSINGDSVTISFGEIKQEAKNEKEQKPGQSKIKTTFLVEDGVHNVNIGFLDTWIREHALVPRSLDEEKDVKETKDEGVKRHGSFWSRFYDRLSVADLLAGGKLYLDSIEKFLKEGQEELAARFANSLWLPEEIKADLRAREEGAKKKRMDDYVEKLKGIDSGLATKMIEGWLLNKNSSEPKKEAGLAFMMEKYGTLCAKSGLEKYSGKFLWYKAFGGKVGDALFNDVKRQQEEKDQAFTEEQLIYVLLVKQCKDGGYNGIKRRTKLHKEFRGMRSAGKEEEFKKGKSDAGDISKCDDIVDFALSEILGGTYPNGIGGLDEAVDRGGSMKVMNKIPFVMLFSGVAYSMEEASRDIVRKMPLGGKVLPITSFMRFQSGMDLMNKTILELSQRIEEKGGSQYAGIGVGAQKIFANMRSASLTNKEKMENCIEFYNKYGEVLIEALYGLNIGAKSENAYINDIIYLEKDDYVDEDGKKQPGSATFKKYYNTVQEETQSYHYKEEYMSDAFKGAGLSGFDTLKTMEFALDVMSNGSFKNKHGAPVLLEEVLGKIDFIKKSSDLTKANKKKLILKNLKGIVAALTTLSLDGFNKSTQILTFLSKLGIDLKEIKPLGSTEHEVLHCKPGTKEYTLLSKYADEILDGTSKKTKNVDDNEVFDILSGVKGKTDTALG